LKRSEATIRDWVFHNKIPFYKVNGNVCFYGQDLNEWFESIFKIPDYYEETGIHRSKIRKSDKRTLQYFNNFIENLK
jgi:excisionase family DNA binding protein